MYPQQLSTQQVCEKITPRNWLLSRYSVV